MNTEILIDLTAAETGLSKPSTEATLNAALKIIRGAVASRRVVILPDFGKFETRHIFDKDFKTYEENPQAGDPIDDVIVVKFLPAEAFRKEVNHRS